MSSSLSQLNSAQAQLLQDIENFSATGFLHDETLTPSELRALARAQLDIDLSDPVPARVATVPQPAKPTPVTPAQPLATAVPAAAPAIAPGPAVDPTKSGGLLAQLKRQAEEKLASETRNVAVEAERLKRIDLGLRAAYRYLKELVTQLNVIRPPFPGDYPLGTILRLEKLVWHESNADFRRKIGPTEDLPFENVTLRYVLRGNTPIVLEKTDHLVETTRKTLSDFGLTFSLDEKRNFKGFIERGRFVVQPEIKAGLLFHADYDKATLQLRTRNVQRFGSAVYNVPAETITEQTLEEIAMLILGQSNQFIQRFQRIS